MTDKQISAARRALPPRFGKGSPPVLTKEQEQAYEELACRNMINSILCYDGEGALDGNRYLIKYIKSLGAKKVLELCNEQIEDFNKAVVKRDVYTDSEGLSYNAIVWADEV